MKEYIQVTNEKGLSVDIVIGFVGPLLDKTHTILGGDSNNPTWQEYLDDYKDEFKPHIELIRKAIEANYMVGYTGQDADDLYFKFSDENVFGFSWRGWGDLMQAIVNKKEGYMAYYM
jgi:hypothetical protein